MIQGRRGVISGQAAMALSLSLLVAACSKHVELQAPDRAAPEAERLEAYERLSAAGQLDEVTLSGSGKEQGRTTRYMVLGDGRRVHHASDLIPVVEAESATARAAERSRSARQKRFALTAVGFGGAIVGTALASHALSDVSDDGVGPMFWAGFGIVSVVGVGGVLGGHYFRGVERDERVSAFATYDPSLRTRLDLCVDGTRVVGCSAEGEPPALSADPEPDASSSEELDEVDAVTDDVEDEPSADDEGEVEEEAATS
jgi:hypothetical protein